MRVGGLWACLEVACTTFAHMPVERTQTQKCSCLYRGGKCSCPAPGEEGEMRFSWAATNLYLLHPPNVLSFSSHFLSWPGENKVRLHQTPYEIKGLQNSALMLAKTPITKGNHFQGFVRKRHTGGLCCHYLWEMLSHFRRWNSFNPSINLCGEETKRRKGHSGILKSDMKWNSKLYGKVKQ